MKEDSNYYETLGVSRNAQPEVIKAAFKALANKHHPDKNPNNSNAEHLTKLIIEAYETLSDPVQRAAYNRILDEQKHKVENDKSDRRQPSSSGYSEGYKNTEKTKARSTNTHNQSYNTYHRSTTYTHSKPFWFFNSRMTRRQYALLMLPTVIVWSILHGIVIDNITSNHNTVILVFISYFLAWSFMIFLAIKRLHDCNYLGWWCLIPFVNIVLFFTRGTKGDNRFGYDPRKKNQSFNNHRSHFEKDHSGWLIVFGVLLINLIVFIKDKDSHTNSRKVIDSNHSLSYTSDYSPNQTPKPQKSSPPEQILLSESQPVHLSTQSEVDLAKQQYNLAVNDINNVWDSLPDDVRQSLLSEQRNVNEHRESICKDESSILNGNKEYREVMRYNCEVELLNKRTEYLEDQAFLSSQKQPEQSNYNEDRISLADAKESYELAVAAINSTWNDLPSSVRKNLLVEQRKINQQREAYCLQIAQDLKVNDLKRDTIRYQCEIELLNDRNNYLKNKKFYQGSKGDENNTQDHENNLRNLIQIESNRKISLLNRTDVGYSYKLSNEQIFRSDINGDGVEDAIVGLEYCEATNCHLTTNSFDLAIFIGLDNTKYRYVDSKNLGLIGSIIVDNEGIIRVEVQSFADSDPHCCPSITNKRNFKFENNSLVEFN